MKKNRLIYFIFLLCFANSYVVSARNLKTNIDLLGELYFQLLQGTFAKAVNPDSSRLVIQQTESSAANWLIENEIIKWAKGVGFEKCFTGKSATVIDQESDYLLQYKNISLSVNYGDDAESGEISRTLSAELYLKLLSPSRQVLFSGIEKKILHDAVSKKDIQRVENEKYPFTIGNKNRPFLSRILEPSLLSIVTGGIIYLFYSYRSQ